MLSLGHILISYLVAANLFMHSLPGMILFHLAMPFLHWRCCCMRYEYDLSYLCRKCAGMWVCAWPSDLHAENPSNIAPVPHNMCMWKAIHPVYTKHGWHTHQSCTITVTRNGTGFMMLLVPVLVQESVQEIMPYTASGHVIEILNCCISKSTGSKHLWEIWSVL